MCVLCVSTCVIGAGVKWVETRNAAEHPAVHRRDSQPQGLSLKTPLYEPSKGKVSQCAVLQEERNSFTSEIPLGNRWAMKMN